MSRMHGREEGGAVAPTGRAPYFLGSRDEVSDRRELRAVVISRGNLRLTKRREWTKGPRMCGHGP